MLAKSKIITRKIRLLDVTSLGKAIDHLSRLGGVRSVTADVPGNAAVEVEYDQCVTTYQALLKQLQAGGFEVQPGFFNSIKSQWFDYIDNTAQENAAAPPPACCNKPPKKL